MAELMLAGEAARLLAVSVATVRNMERDGRLPAMKTRAGVRVFTRAAVEALAAARLAGEGNAK